MDSMVGWQTRYECQVYQELGKPSNKDLPPLAVLLGPTASGKTAIAVLIAEMVGGEIISADSVALYREMNKGTAKPGENELRRVPHHMIDHIGLGDHYSAVHFAVDADRVIRDILKRGRIPLVVGGTPLYLRSLIRGLLPGVGEDHGLREVLSGLTAAELAEELKSVDPESADRIHHNDRKRLMRAVEIFRLTGRPKSWHVRRLRSHSRYRTLRIGLTRDRNELHERIDRRVDVMFDEGLVREVEGLLASGLEKVLLNVGAIGYKEIIGYLKGDYELEKARALIKRRTKDFARRQMSWFKSEHDITWFSLDGNDNVGLIIKLAEEVRLFFARDI